MLDATLMQLVTKVTWSSRTAVVLHRRLEFHRKNNFNTKGGGRRLHNLLPLRDGDSVRSDLGLLLETNRRVTQRQLLNHRNLTHAETHVSRRLTRPPHPLSCTFRFGIHTFFFKTKHLLLKGN